MSRKAFCYDNVAIGVFATQKTECFSEQLPNNRAEAQAMLFVNIETLYGPMLFSLRGDTSRILKCLAPTISSKLTISCPRFRRQIK
jgi:hypothetical protein